MEKIDKAEVVEIGEVKISVSWTNLYIKFKLPSGEQRWFYYSEHVDKPVRLKQIKDFTQGRVKVGDFMTVNYKIVQARNKSTKLAIVNLSNYDLKK